jgi:hypothetical protein
VGAAAQAAKGDGTEQSERRAAAAHIVPTRLLIRGSSRPGT